LNPSIFPGILAGLMPADEFIVLKISEGEASHVREVKIDRTKRIPDNTGCLERLVLLRSLDVISDHDVDALKQLCYSQGAKYVESEHAVAQIIAGAEGGKINVARFLKLCKQRKVPQAKLEAALSVTKERCSFLSADDLKSICDPPAAPPPPRLTIELRKDVARIDTVEAIDRLAQQARAGAIQNWQPKPKAGATPAPPTSSATAAPRKARAKRTARA
jgi:hypothetical protein